MYQRWGKALTRNPIGRKTCLQPRGSKRNADSGEAGHSSERSPSSLEAAAHYKSFQIVLSVRLFIYPGPTLRNGICEAVREVKPQVHRELAPYARDGDGT